MVKQILPQLAQDPNFIRMFVQEANTLVQMSHPNIVPVYELGVVDGVYFLAMELVEGATLAELLRAGPLPESLVAHMGIQICDALHYAHDRFSVIHRDVTPRNLVIDDAGHARLLDFGIAAPADEAGRFGSLGYMSPEQARGLPVGPQSDLFSVGTLLFEALSGEPAYLRDTAEATRVALLEAPAPHLADNVASSEMRAWVAKCLASDVQARPTTAAEVAKALRGLLAKTHPSGVAEELGRRAHDARTKTEVQDDDQVHTTDEPERTAPVAAKVRTLATSPIFEQLLQQTERIDRASPALPIAPTPSAIVEAEVPQTQIAQAPTTVGTTGTGASRWSLGFGVVAVIALGFWALSPLQKRPPKLPREVTAAPENATSTTTTTSLPVIVPDPIPTKALAPIAPVVVPTSAADSPVNTDNTNARAWLVINALPWAEVKLDGRALGSTPVRRATTDAGKHTLELRCPPLGRSARVSLQPKAGETLRVLVNLNQDPPVITVK